MRYSILIGLVWIVLVAVYVTTAWPPAAQGSSYDLQSRQVRALEQIAESLRRMREDCRR